MKNPYILVCIAILFISSCNNEQAVEQSSESNYIEITKEQFLSEKMMIGSPEMNAVEEKVYFTGRIIPLLNGRAKINAPVEGIVEEIKVYAGQKISINEPLLKIGGNAVIELQQEFAISSAKIKQLRASYERVKKLFDENIKTENEFMLVESEYKAELANYKSLILKLQRIDLSISNIEKGNYVTAYMIRSPIAGQISKLSVLPGQYVKRENEIAEIVNKRNVELQLSFFVKDLPKLKQGQNVFFNGLDNSTYYATATISRIGTKLNSNSNIVECYASLSKEFKNNFAINQMVHGEVIVSSDSVLTVPQHAIISQGNDKYIIVVAQETERVYQFIKQKVTIGKSDKDNAELLDLKKNVMILLDGVENIVFE